MNVVEITKKLTKIYPINIIFKLVIKYDYIYIGLINVMNLLKIIPISIKKNNGIYQVNDGNQIIFITRKNRLVRYLSGIDNAMNSLACAYHLNKINFSKDDVVIDIGANVGELSLWLSRQGVNQVYSYEPDKVEYSALAKNCEKNPNIVPFQMAMFSTVGKMKLYSDNKNGDSGLIFSGRYEEEYEVDVATLDCMINELGLKKIKVLKIEAEGAEPEILYGISVDMLKRIEYITIDCGPERGLDKEYTLIPCVNLLLKNKFEIKEINYQRMSVLFYNSINYLN